MREAFGCFPVSRSRLRESNTVFIKVNAVFHHPHLFTSLSIIAAAVDVIREHGPDKKIFIMDNCSQGNFTRHCFAATGIDRAARKMGVKCLYLDEDHVCGYFGAGGADQIETIQYFVEDELGIEKGRLGYETGMATYTAEGWMTHYEYQRFSAALPELEFVNAHDIVDKVSLIKDEGTINRFREVGRIVDEGHKAAREAIENGGWKGMTETELAGIAALAMRRAGSVSEWNFAGLNEISSGWRTGLGACTPPTTKEFAAGEPLMFDLHAMFKLALGDHSHNYLIAPAAERQRWHADNFVACVQFVADSYRAGATPGDLITECGRFAEDRGFSDFILPGVEHGIGLFGDEWRVGASMDVPIPYWTDPNHVYQEKEMVILAMQYAAPEDGVGFRYETPIVIEKDGCELTSKDPLAIEEIK